MRIALFAKHQTSDNQDRLVELEGAPLGVALLGPDGGLLSCSDGFARLVGGESPTTISGTLVFSEPELYSRLAERLQETHRLDRVEVGLRHQDGSTVDVSATLIAPEGEKHGVLLLAQDVSDRRRLARRLAEAQKLAVLGKLSRGVTHDFNNHLTEILGYCELARLPGMSPEDVLAHLEQIRDAGLKASKLIQRLRSFGGPQPLPRERLDLNQLIKGMDKLVQRMLGTQIELRFQSNERPAWIVGNTSQIEQVLLGLSAYARDRMSGQGVLKVWVFEQEVPRTFVLRHDVVRPGPYIFLAMRNSGNGVEDDDLDRLFEPQLPGEDDTETSLPTVYAIVKEHGGFVSVYNEPDGGATFKASFPRALD
jgi:signal transduction histidine kinase